MLEAQPLNPILLALQRAQQRLRRISPLKVVYGSTTVFSFTSIAHESNFVTATSFLFGDTATQVGILLGSVFLGYALGSAFSKRVADRWVADIFLAGECLLTLVAGFSIVIAFWAYSNSPSYIEIIRGTIVVVSILVGIEDALLMRYAHKYESETRDAIGNALGWSFFGSAIAGFLFGPVLVPILGGVMTLALALGIIDGIVVAVTSIYFRHEARGWMIYLMISVLSVVLLTSAYVNHEELSENLTDTLFEDTVVQRWDSIYGSLVLTQEQQDFRLYIAGGLQFSSADEVQYHEPLVYPSLALASMRTQNRPLSVAILGGGDGLATRDVLKHANVDQVVVIDIDPIMTEQVAQSPQLLKINQGSLRDPRVSVRNEDAFSFIRDTNMTFDVIIVDLVDPDTEVTSKLYAYEFYQMAKQRLNHGGVFVSQSTSPWYSPEAFWTINITLQQAFDTVVPYRWAVPSFGDWGWNMASDVPFTAEEIVIAEDHSQWLSQQLWFNLQSFGKDEWAVQQRMTQAGSVNRLTHSILPYLYNNSSRWDRWDE